MATIKHIFKGESLSMLFAFPAEYDMARIQSHGVWIGGTEFTGVIIGQGIELKLTSLQTDLMSGNQRVSLWIDDTILGVRKPYVGDIAVGNTNALPDNESTSEVYDVIVNVDISVTSIEAGDLMFNYVKGDPLTYDDLTPEQIAELQQPATDAIASIQEVELAVETAEGLRQQAELNRQTNTSTAISNAEQATDDANDAAILANEKAGLANDAALLANEKAGLAATATTQANDARDGANSAAQSATNLVNSYATDLAAKELKANKQNSLEVDGTGTKFPTVDAVNAGLAASSNLLYQYIHSGNKEVYISSIDYATNTFTSVGHGLVNGDRLNIKIIGEGIIEQIIPFSANPIADNQIAYYVINSNLDTFQISLTNGGAAVPTINKATQNFSLWRFERTNAINIDINLPAIGCDIEVLGDIGQMHRQIWINNNYLSPKGYVQNVTNYQTATQVSAARFMLLRGRCNINVRRYGNITYINRKTVGINLEPTDSTKIKWVSSDVLIINTYPVETFISIILSEIRITNGTILNVYKI